MTLKEHIRHFLEVFEHGLWNVRNTERALVIRNLNRKIEIESYWGVAKLARHGSLEPASKVRILPPQFKY